MSYNVGLLDTDIVPKGRETLIEASGSAQCSKKNALTACKDI